MTLKGLIGCEFWGIYGKKAKNSEKKCHYS